MTEILFVGINARYNHTNLAIRSIIEYVKKHLPGIQEKTIDFEEWTISQYTLEIVRGIVKHKPKLVSFSVYIWNTRLVFDIIRELRKVLPETLIIVGGPDVSYRAEDVFKQYPELDILIQGEGERTTLELVEEYNNVSAYFNKNRFLENLQSIKGLYVRLGLEKIVYGGVRDILLDMQDLAFAYPTITENNTKIFYYESSRGCPFMCSYCLSSIEKSVRFMPINRVCEDLQKFLDANVKIVKFVDRTFNLHTERYLSIWKYIVENHNNYTMFHFEISAEHLDEKALDFLQTVKEGVMQFEVGVQSINEDTLKEIRRPANLIRLQKNIKKIPKTIHSHLDIIAGLPHETLETFATAFNFTISLKPDMLQMGFLKILSGTVMEEFAKRNLYEWQSTPMYEVLTTPSMSYDELCFLHDVEMVLEWYYNSHNFDFLFSYLLDNTDNPFELFSKITCYFEQKAVFDVQHKTQALFSLLDGFFREHNFDNNTIILELLRFDYFKMGKTSVFPECFDLHYNKDFHHAALLKYTDIQSTRQSYANSSYEEFSINPYTLKKEKTKILFLYGERGKKEQKTSIVLIDKKQTNV